MTYNSHFLRILSVAAIGGFPRTRASIIFVLQELENGVKHKSSSDSP